jgi:hypothetical protein
MKQMSDEAQSKFVGNPIYTEHLSQILKKQLGA